MKQLLIALLLLAGLSYAQGSANCSQDWSFSSATTGPAIQTISGAQAGCAGWRLTWSVTGFTAVTIQLEGSQDGVTYAAFGSTLVVEGANPTNWTAATTSNTIVVRANLPYVRADITGVTGSGTVKTSIRGYSGTSAASSFVIPVGNLAINFVPYVCSLNGLCTDTTAGRQLYRDPINGFIGIGTLPATNLHVFGTLPEVRIQDASIAGNYFYIMDSAAKAVINKIVATGGSTIGFNPLPLDGSGGATIQIFRNTNTIGVKVVQFDRGNNTNTVHGQIGVDGQNSFFNNGGGNLEIGGTNPGSKLTVLGGDAWIDGPAVGVILRDTAVTANCYRITIAAGAVTLVPVACPAN